MKEIGGYIELDTYCGEMLHKDGLKLNSGRNAFEYLIVSKGIKKILMPKFMCSSCAKMIVKYGAQMRYYSIGFDFKPIIEDRENDEWLYVVNYYGQFSNEYLSSLGDRVIVDSVMAYFQEPIEGVDTLYSCRKYFGVPDGAILYTDKFLKDIEQDVSYQRMNYLLGRYEKGAQPFYEEYVENNHYFSDCSYLKMSRLTENLLNGIDYDFVKNRRTDNFEFLHKEFKYENELQLVIPEGAFMYPLYIKNADQIRKKLQSEKIYIPTLWPAVYDLCDETDLEYCMAKNILPLPVDQRYNLDDMKFLVKKIECLL